MESLKTTKNYSSIYTTRIPSTVKTYQTIGYLLTDTERTVAIVILCSIAGIIVITGKMELTTNFMYHNWSYFLNSLFQTISLIFQLCFAAFTSFTMYSWKLLSAIFVPKEFVCMIGISQLPQEVEDIAKNALKIIQNFLNPFQNHLTYDAQHVLVILNYFQRYSIFDYYFI